MSQNLIIIILSAIFILYGVSCIIIIRMFLRKAEKDRKAEILLKNNEIIVPLRIQAYERLILFLERISPDSLLTRHNQTGLTARQFHTILLTSIRNEYEHNLSQQVFISSKAWEMVKNARTQMTKIINTAAEKTNPNAPSLEFSKKILELASEYDKLPTQVAIEAIKKEIQMLF